MAELDLAVEAVGKNGTERKSKNLGGMAIFIVYPGNRKEEVSSVSFVRRNSKNPKVSFRDQMKVELDKARAVIEAHNELTAKGEME